MTEDVLNYQDIDIIVVEMRSHAMTQRMAGDVEGHFKRDMHQDFF